MGFLDRFKPKPSKPKARSRQETTPEALRGPDPGTLVSAEEIEATTGSPPVGDGDRRSGGIDVDTGFMRVCIWQLADGGELLVNFTRFRDDDGVALWRSRWDDPGWRNVDDEKPLEGVGEAGRWYVTKASKGGTELHVTAKQGMFQSQIVHTSPAGSRDVAPVTQLLTTVLGRLNG
jgi:hypothetical protein